MGTEDQGWWMSEPRLEEQWWSNLWPPSPLEPAVIKDVSCYWDPPVCCPAEPPSLCPRTEEPVQEHLIPGSTPHPQPQPHSPPAGSPDQNPCWTPRRPEKTPRPPPGVLHLLSASFTHRQRRMKDVMVDGVGSARCTPPPPPPNTHTPLQSVVDVLSSLLDGGSSHSV